MNNVFELINEMNRTPFQLDRFYLQAKLQGLSDEALGEKNGMAAIIVDGDVYDAAVAHDEVLKANSPLKPKYEGKGQTMELAQATINGVNLDDNNLRAYRVRA